jgi:hypothetical protein
MRDRMAQRQNTSGVERLAPLRRDEPHRLPTIEWIHVRHQEVTAFAASAEAHLTGELAVCVGNCGPGNLPRSSGWALVNVHGG